MLLNHFATLKHKLTMATKAYPTRAPHTVSGQEHNHAPGKSRRFTQVYGRAVAQIYETFHGPEDCERAHVSEEDAPELNPGAKNGTAATVLKQRAFHASPVRPLTYSCHNSNGKQAQLAHGGRFFLGLELDSSEDLSMSTNPVPLFWCGR